MVLDPSKQQQFGTAGVEGVKKHRKAENIFERHRSFSRLFLGKVLKY